MKLGGHVFPKGGFQNLTQQVNKFEISAAQIVFTAPIRWSLKEIDEGRIDTLVDSLNNDSQLKALLVHGVYLTNLARKDKALFHKSKESLRTYVTALDRLISGLNREDLEVHGVTFHPGSAKDLSPQEGIERIAYGMDWILERTDKAQILFESAAGAGNVLGSKLDELAQMYDLVSDEYKGRIGYVLDTQHMWASGYDWNSSVKDILDEVDSKLKLSNVKCFHLNNSLTELASNKDRHANLNEGLIDIDAIAQIINDPRLSQCTFILETPAMKDEESAIDEFKLLHSLVN